MELLNSMNFSSFYFKEFEFWDAFCPKYNWVAPESGATTGKGYLKTTWDRATSIHAINFRLVFQMLRHNVFFLPYCIFPYATSYVFFLHYVIEFVT